MATSTREILSLRTWPGAVPAARGRRRQRWRPEQSAWIGLALALPYILMLAVMVVYPFVRLTLTAFGPPHGRGNFVHFWDNRANLAVMRITFVDAAYVTVITVGIGTLTAWWLRTTQSRMMRLLILSAIFVPLWMGSVIKLYAFTILLQRLGAINLFLLKMGMIAEPLDLLYTQTAVIIGMVYQLLPYAVLPLYVSFASIDLDLIQAAEGLGASRVRAIASIVTPLATPGILATATIVYVISLGFYLTPVILGGATSPFTATLISQNIFDFFDLAGASVSAILLLLGALIAVTLGYLLVGRERLRRALA